MNHVKTGSLSSEQIVSNFFTPHRLIAFLVHFFASLAVLSGLFLLVRGIWFPGVLFHMSGGQDGLFIVAGVDLILGPLLTLVVYDVKKRRAALLRDVCVIALLQALCFLAGVAVVYQAKPVAMIHVFDTFHVVSQSDFKGAGQSLDRLAQFEGRYPKVLFVETSGSRKELVEGELLGLFNGNLPKQLRVDLYREFPRDPERARALLHSGDESSNKKCILQNISSAFSQGLVCFDPAKRTFGNFRAGASLSTFVE